MRASVAETVVRSHLRSPDARSILAVPLKLTVPASHGRVRVQTVWVDGPPPRTLQFLTAMAQVQQGMILGVDKNVYVEPAIWTEWARNFYKYPVTRSN
jgi:hypothetical protein